MRQLEVILGENQFLSNQAILYYYYWRDHELGNRAGIFVHAGAKVDENRCYLFVVFDNRCWKHNRRFPC